MVVPKRDKTIQLLHAGSQLAGSVVANAITILSGPDAALAGATLGVLTAETIDSVGAELLDRRLASRQEARIGAAAAYAVCGIWNRRAAGEVLRKDGVFDRGITNRSSSEEVLEGVLLVAGEAFEERKLRYIASTYEDFAYSSISPASTHLFVHRLRAMTYRQLAILACINRVQEFGLSPGSFSYFTGELERDAILNEIGELFNLGLIRSIDGGADDDILTNGLTLTHHGQVLMRTANLTAIPQTDIEELVACHLRR